MGKCEHLSLTEGAAAELIETAYHEAGHAVMGCICGRPPRSVDIRRDQDGNAGHTHFDKDIPYCTKTYFDQSDEKRRYIEVRVLTGIAGTIAHDLLCPGRTHDAGDERDQAHQKDIIADTVSWHDHDDYLQGRKIEARQMLTEHWSWVAAVAAALVQKIEISGEELIELINSTPISPHP